MSWYFLAESLSSGRFLVYELVILGGINILQARFKPK
jgi:hypothetical protein